MPLRYIFYVACDISWQYLGEKLCVNNDLEGILRKHQANAVRGSIFAAGGVASGEKWARDGADMGGVRLEASSEAGSSTQES
jgi:hypothetical protein